MCYMYYPTLYVAIHHIRVETELLQPRRHRLAQVGFRARRLIEVMRKFVHEMVFSDNRAADNDVNAAVDDVRMYAIERIVKES